MGRVSYDDLQKNFSLLRKQPEKFLELAEQFIRDNPDHSGGYFKRHFAWDHLKQPEKALADLETSYRLEPRVSVHVSKGALLHKLGRYAEAIREYDELEKIDPDEWHDSLLQLYRADCHARLGNEAAALADCINLKEDHFLPYGLGGTPRGNKQQVIEEIRRRAAAARGDGPGPGL